MKSNYLQKLFWVTIAATVCMPMGQAADPNWASGTRAEAPWNALDAVLENAVSVLYLDNSCNVIAFLSPDPADIGRYVPKTKKLLARWYDRIATNSVSCGTLTFLPTTPKGGTAAPICDPNALVMDDPLTLGICQIVPNAVKNLIVLDDRQAPLLVLTGESAKEFAQGRFSATILGRTRFDAGCTPALPSPCLAPKTGVLIKVNGVSTCRCQLPP